MVGTGNPVSSDAATQLTQVVVPDWLLTVHDHGTPSAGPIDLIHSRRRIGAWPPENQMEATISSRAIPCLR